MNEVMEGQEAVWVEETVEESPDKKAQGKKKITLMRKKKRNPPKKILTTKTKVVLPESEPNTMPSQPVQKKKDEEAFTNLAEYARQLLEQGLSPNDPQSGDEVENKKLEMIEMAFRYAVEARLTCDLGGEEDQEALVSRNAEEGKTAAAKARRILSKGPSSLAAKGSGGVPTRARSFVEKDGTVELMNRQADSPDSAKMAVDVDEFASQAREALESILRVDDEPISLKENLSGIPSGVSDKSKEVSTIMSTLGFDNTFDNGDALTITSLNEIMDGPITPVMASQKQTPVSTSQKQTPVVASQKKVEEEKKGPFSMFRKRTKRNKEVTSANIDPKVDNKKPVKPEKNEVRYFEAKIVGDGEDEKEPDPLFDLAELEKIRNAEERTGSKLKEALAMDRTGSLQSWDGVPLHDEPEILAPDEIRRDQKKDPMQPSEKGNLSSLPPRNPADLMPKFVPAPKGDPAILTARSWSLLKEEEEKRTERELQDLLSAEAAKDTVDDSSVIEVVRKKGKQKKKFGLFKVGPRQPDEDEVSMTSLPDDIPPELLEQANIQCTPPRDLNTNLTDVGKMSPLGSDAGPGRNKSIDDNEGNELPKVLALSASSDLFDESMDNEQSKTAPEIVNQENIVPLEKAFELTTEKENGGKKADVGRWSSFGKGRNRKKSFKI